VVNNPLLSLNLRNLISDMYYGGRMGYGGVLWGHEV